MYHEGGTILSAPPSAERRQKRERSRGKAASLEDVQVLFASDQFEDQWKGAHSIRALDPDDALRALDSFTKHFRENTERAAEKFYATENDYGLLPERNDHFIILGKIMGKLVASLPRQWSSKEQPRCFETVILSIVQQYLEYAYSVRPSDSQAEFVQRLARRDVESHPRFASSYEISIGTGTPQGMGGAEDHDDVQAYMDMSEMEEFDERIQPINRLFGAMAKVGGERSLDLLVAWLQFDEIGSNTISVADTLSAIDPTGAAHRLLPLLRSASQRVERDAAWALHRLEFGHIGISNDGVRYLEQRYDLGDFNQPDTTVQRITADGKMGIFDASGTLQKWFPLEGLGEHEAVIRARVLEVTSRMLTTPRNGETSEERLERERFLEEFRSRYGQFLNNPFFEGTGLRPNNFGLKEQGQTLRFLAEASEPDKERAHAHIARYGEDGFRAFLSLEHEMAMGEHILALGEQLNPRLAARLFSTYSKIVHAAEDVRSFLRTHVAMGDPDDEQRIDAITATLLLRGEQILTDRALGEKTAEEQNTVIDALDRVNGGILLFASTFKALSQTDALHLTEIAGSTIGTKAGVAVTEDERAACHTLIEENYREQPGICDMALRGFDAALARAGTEVHMLKYEDDLVAFIRFDERPHHRVYAGSLNVRADVRGSSIGSAMLHATLDKKAETHPIDAVTNADNSMLKHYVEDFGFVIRGVEENYDNTGERFVMMERDDVARGLLKGSALSLDALKSGSADGVIVHSATEADLPALLQSLAPALNEHTQLISRMVKDPETKRVFVVVEPVPLQEPVHAS